MGGPLRIKSLLFMNILLFLYLFYCLIFGRHAIKALHHSLRNEVFSRNFFQREHLRMHIVMRVKRQYHIFCWVKIIPQCCPCLRNYVAPLLCQNNTFSLAKFTFH